MTAIQRPRGTRDFAPAEAHLRRRVAERVRGVFHRFGYREVQTPTFEDLALFTAKSGEGIREELYAFKDKGGRDICLRPELTAPVMRMYHESHFNEPKPLKWYYFGNCFRYDRPQAGRYREFWQFGCEQVGSGSPLAYAELLALGDAIYRELGLQARELFVGHVKVLAHLVDAFGFDAATRTAMMRAIDKRDDPEIRRLAGMGRGEAAAGGEPLVRLLAVMEAPDVATARRALAGSMEEALLELEQVFGHLEDLGVAGARLNLGIARGLDYYSGIVFEVHCPILGAEKQLLGGGGYDLSQVFGSQPTPTMGFGLGFDRSIVALQAEAQSTGRPLPIPPEPGPALYLAGLGPAALKFLLPVAADLRSQGIAVELDLMGRKPGAVAKHASDVGAERLVVLGERDLAAGSVEVKQLATGTVTRATLVHLGPELAQMCAKSE